jgi:alpha-L-rhamnosidase
MHQVTHLLSEYRINPLGLDEAQPRLFWQMETTRRGARQTAYRITAADSESDLRAETALLWDSGKVISDQSTHVPYAGASLRSRQRVFWQVCVWDENDQSATSAPAWFEMGLLTRDDWQAQWIGSRLIGGPQTTSPCPFLRKPFTLQQPPQSARLYITALGLYEAYINGQKVGSDTLTPGWTDYHQRVQYQTYDVTELLSAGQNVLGVILGDGWYCGHVEWGGRQRYGDRPRLLAQLMVRLADGSHTVIASDGTWRTTAGPLLESDLLMGESYDARLELPGWNTPDYDDARWLPVESFDDPGIALVASASPPVRSIQELQPIAEPREISSWPKSKWVFDLGQNMVGRARLKISGEAGTTIKLRFAEVLNPDGTIYTANLRSARQTDHYTLRGSGEEIYEPRFTFHGFRYVELSGFAGTPDRNMITGIVLHTDLQPTGTFTCSNPLLNQLQHNITWGQKGNFVDVPTDCPQRDERLGWTGDAQVFVRTAAFNMNIAPMFTKWQQDIADAQFESGSVPCVVPNTGIIDADGGPAWADAVIICPWTLWLCYGDTRLLTRHYNSMARYVAYMVNTSKDLIRAHPAVDNWGGFGDWLSINAETPKDLIGTAFLAYDASLMAQIAAVLGKDEDTARYRRLFEDVRQAFQRRFVTADGLLAGATQTAYVLALHFDLLPEALRPAALENLIRDIEKRDLHLSTGFVGSPYLPHVLSDNDHLDFAYRLLMQQSWPSWLYAVTQGATTIWERWDGWTHDKGFQDPSMNSFNHYAYGAIGAWLYAVTAGLNPDTAAPGYKHIILRPRPGANLTHAQVTYDSLYGRIVSVWSVENGVFDWRVVIPPNTSATLHIPAATNTEISGDTDAVTLIERTAAYAQYRAAAGEYHFIARD